MSPTKNLTAAALRKAVAVPSAAADAAPAAAVPERRPRPEKPVRFTLDLDRAHHQFLKNYAVEVEAGGASRVLRALLDELRDDPELARRVRDRIWQGS